MLNVWIIYGYGWCIYHVVMMFTVCDMENCPVEISCVFPSKQHGGSFHRSFLNVDQRVTFTGLRVHHPFYVLRAYCWGSHLYSKHGILRPAVPGGSVINVAGSKKRWFYVSKHLQWVSCETLGDLNIYIFYDILHGQVQNPSIKKSQRLTFHQVFVSRGGNPSLLGSLHSSAAAALLHSLFHLFRNAWPTQ